MNENVNENVSENVIESITYSFAEALQFILSGTCCLRNVPYTRKDNVQFVIKTILNIGDGCGRWVKLKTETSTKYKNNMLKMMRLTLKYCIRLTTVLYSNTLEPLKVIIQGKHVHT